MDKEIYNAGKAIFAGCPELKTAGLKGYDSYDIEFKESYDETNEYTYIPANLFSDANIESVYLFNINHIEENAFENTNIKEIYFDQTIARSIGKSNIENSFTNAVIDNILFAESDEIWNEYVKIEGDFNYEVLEDNYCTLLKQVVLGNGIKTIPSYAFYRCDYLETVYLGESITSIGYKAFEDCISLDDIIIPNSVTQIEERAFYRCNSLTRIEIPASVKTIGNSAFCQCLKLESVIIGDKEEQSDFSAIGTSAFQYCSSLKEVIIGNGVKEIPIYAFSSCRALESVNLEKNITSIGYQAFSYCDSLATINYAGTEEEWHAITKYIEWDINSGTYTIKYNCDIEIVETCTVTFKDYDGMILKMESIAKGKAATAPADPVREGYTFAGWDKLFDNVTSDLVVTATYTIVDPEECTHTNKTFVDYIYENITYIDTTSHSVKVISRYKCTDCKEAITDYANAIVKTEAHVHDFVVNGGWVCRCGHIQDVAFEAYKAHLQSDVNRTTYYDSQLTVRYGTVYVSDEITVIGSTDNAYLIKYPLDAGGYKFAFIEKQYIDKRVYEKNSKINVYVNGKTVSAVNNNEKVYANLNELMSAFGDEAYITEQNGYSLTIRVRNTKTREIYELTIDLANYLTKNWADVYATKVGETQYVPGFCVGAYVYTDNIFIEFQEFMDLLEFQREENCYIPSDVTVDLKLYANALHILNGGANFDAQYESLHGETFGWWSSLLYKLLNGKWENVIESNDYNTDEEIVEAIKQMLYDRSYPVDISQIQVNYEGIQALGGLFSMLEDGTNIIGMTMEEWDKYFGDILKAEGFGDVFGNLSSMCDDFNEMLGSAQNTIEKFELVKMKIEEVTVMVTLQFKYEENMAVLDLLIENEDNTKVIAVYEKVKEELMAYYGGIANGLFHTWKTEGGIREAVVDDLLGFCIEKSEDAFMKKASLSNPYCIAYEITCFVANEVFHGEALYDAQDGIYRIHNSLETYLPSMRNAINDYYSTPTRENTDRLIATAVIAANLRIQASDYCIDYVSSKVFDNSEDVYKNEKTVFESTLQNIKNIFAELSK